MARAIDVAKFLLYLGSQDENVNDLSNLKLQKLLYYSQAASYQITDRPLFDEPLEAWQFGPVVKEVYKEYSAFGSLPIEEQVQREGENDYGLTPEEMQAAIVAWSKYGDKQPWELVNSTHSEMPWLNAWRNGYRRIADRDMSTLFGGPRDVEYY